MEDKRWFAFMATDRWVVFMNIMRIITLLAVVLLILIMVRNIEEVKTIANPCTMCTIKTNATCMITNTPGIMSGFDLTNINLRFEP